MRRKATPLTAEQQLSHKIISVNLDRAKSRAAVIKAIEEYIKPYAKAFGFKKLGEEMLPTMVIYLYASVRTNFSDKASLMKSLDALDQPKGANLSLRLFKNALANSFKLDERLQNRNPSLNEVLDLFASVNPLLRAGSILSTNTFSSDQNKEAFRHLFDQFLGSAFFRLEFLLANSKEADAFSGFESQFVGIIQTWFESVNDLDTLSILIKRFTDLQLNVLYEGPLSLHLLHAILTISLKALGAFDPMQHDVSVVRTIVEGLLLASSEEDLALALPRLKAAVNRMPSEPAESKVKANRFLTQCEVMLKEDDHVFLEGLEAHFSTLPPPPQAFARLLIQRAERIFCDKTHSFTTNEKLLAKEMSTYYIRQYRPPAVLIPESDAVPTLVSPGEVLNDLLALGARESEGSFVPTGADRQRGLRILRKVNNIQTRSLQHFEEALTVRVSERTNGEDSKTFYVPVYFGAMTSELVKVNIATRFNYCNISQTVDPHDQRQLVYVMRDEPIALSLARGLKVIDIIFGKINSGKNCSEKDLALLRKTCFKADSYDESFEEYSDKDASQSSSDTLLEIFNSDILIAMLDSPIYKMIGDGADDLKPEIAENVKHIIKKILVPLCFRILLSSQSEISSSAINKESRHLALAFLLKPNIFKLLPHDDATESADAIPSSQYMALSLVANKLSEVISDYASSSRLFGTELFRDSIPDLLKMNPFRVSDPRTIESLIEEIKNKTDQLDAILKLAQNAEDAAFLVVHYNWKPEDHSEREVSYSDGNGSYIARGKAKQIEMVKAYRDELHSRGHFLSVYSRVTYSKLVGPLIQYIDQLIVGLGSKHTEARKALRLKKEALSNETSFLVKNHDLVLRLFKGEITERVFITNLLQVENSTTLKSTLSNAVQLANQPKGFSLFPKPQTLCPTLEAFMADHYKESDPVEHKASVTSGGGKLDFSMIEAPLSLSALMTSKPHDSSVLVRRHEEGIENDATNGLDFPASLLMASSTGGGLVYGGGLDFSMTVPPVVDPGQNVLQLVGENDLDFSTVKAPVALSSLFNFTPMRASSPKDDLEEQDALLMDY